jgi:acyl carrier protein
MTRDKIVDLLKKQAAEIVPGLDPAAMDFSRSLRDQGATSLDVVELVSAMMSQLRVKVPRAELAKISTLDGLADVLLRAASQSPAAAPPR